MRGLYDRRFSELELRRKAAVWRILCSQFFQRYVPAESTVLDLGAGHCEFINNIQCGEKYALDLNEDTYRFAESRVKVICGSATDLSFLANNSIDIVFMSNLLEHLNTRDDVVAVLLEAHRVLKTGGSVMLLQPNIRCLYRNYWDFFDHTIPLSDRSLAEALGLAKFRVERIIPRFLPYTLKGSLLRSHLWVGLYLRLPLLWQLLGRQMFALGRENV